MMSRLGSEADLTVSAPAPCGCSGLESLSEDESAFLARVVDRLSLDLNPARVLYHGCLASRIISSLRERGIAVVGTADPRHVADLEDSERGQAHSTNGHGPDPRFDLVVSLGALHDAPADIAEEIVADLSTRADDVIFSPSPLLSSEESIFTLQPPEYWARLFHRHGFRHDLDFELSFISPTAMRFRRGERTVQHLLGSYERYLWSVVTEARRWRSQLFDANQDIIARGHEIRELRWLIEKRDTQVETLSTVSNERQATIDRMRVEAEEGDLELRKAQQLLLKRETQVTNLEQVSAQKDQMITELLAARNEAQLQLKRANAELVSTQNSLASTASELAVTANILATKQRRLDDIMNSRAYRFVMFLWRLRELTVPPGSRRARALSSLAGMVRGRGRS
jgi:hypothetical protein